MRKKKLSTKALSTLIALAMILTLFAGMTGTAYADTNNVERIAGADRYETSAEVATAAFDSADTVIIARGDDEGEFADGLAASVLAGVMDAPILLTRTNSLPSVVEAAIEDLGASEAVVLGGEVAVSEDVETELMALGLEVERIAGETRIETAALIAEEAAEAGDLADYAFVVNGFAPADSLAAGPAAFENNAPILQVREGSVPSVTEDVLEALGIDELFVVGGTAVVSAAVFNQLDDMASVSRLAGADRYETSIEVAKEMYPDAVDYSIVGGFNYADAIGAAVFANPILFVRQDAVPSSVDAYLDDVLTSASILTIFGGTVAVSSGVEDALKAKFVDIPVEFEITDVSALTERGHHARIDFNMAIANISADDIEVIEDATGDELGVKNASTARAGRAANVEFFADDDEVILERGERYIFTVSVAEGTSTYEYVRSYTETGRIVDVDHEDNELRVRYEDNDDFEYKWIEVPDDYDIDLEYILARELRVWFDGDDVLTRHTVESEDVKYDALELIDDEEIELVYEDEEYDFDADVMVRINGEYEDTGEDGIEALLDEADRGYDYAKVVMNGDIAAIDAYIWEDFMLVEEVDVDEEMIYCYSGDELDLEDWVLAKDGKTLDLEDIEEFDIFFYNEDAEYGQVYNDIAAEGEIENVFRNSFEVEGYEYYYLNEEFSDYEGIYSRYLDEDMDLEDFDDDAAEEMQEAGEPVQVFVDYRGEAVYIEGDVEEVAKDEVGGILLEDVDGYRDARGRDMIEFVVVNEMGEEVTVDKRLDDIDEIRIGYEEYDMDNDDEVRFVVEEDDAWVRVPVGETATHIEFNQEDRFAMSEIAALGMVIEMTLDAAGNIVELTFFEENAPRGYGAFYDVRNYESGDRFIEGKRTSSNMPVFIVEDAFDGWVAGENTWVDDDEIDTDDVTVMLFGDIEDDVDLNELDLFYDGRDAEYLVLKDSELEDTSYKLGVMTDYWLNVDDEVTRIEALIDDTETRYWVDDPVREGRFNVGELVLGEAVIIELYDATDEVKEIWAPWEKRIDAAEVDVVRRDREITITDVDGVDSDFELVDDGYIYDVTDPTDIETMTWTELSRVTDEGIAVVFDDDDPTRRADRVTDYYAVFILVGVDVEPPVPVEEYELTINVDGEGTTDPAPGTYTYDEGTDVTVEAIPDEGWEFVGWTGDVTSTDATITVTMDDDKEVTAEFEIKDVTAEDLEMEITPVVPGAFNVSISLAAAENLLGAEAGDTLILTINDEEIELTYDPDNEDFYKTNVQGYTEEELEQAIVTIK